MATMKWMSREGGVDLVAATAPRLEMPGGIVHVARMAHTPAGHSGFPRAVPVSCGPYVR